MEEVFLKELRPVVNERRYKNFRKKYKTLILLIVLLNLRQMYTDPNSCPKNISSFMNPRLFHNPCNDSESLRTNCVFLY